MTVIVIVVIIIIICFLPSIGSIDPEG